MTGLVSGVNHFVGTNIPGLSLSAKCDQCNAQSFIFIGFGEFNVIQLLERTSVSSCCGKVMNIERRLFTCSCETVLSYRSNTTKSSFEHPIFTYGPAETPLQDRYRYYQITVRALPQTRG
ncbi:MAG: hypothetical protein ACM3JI_00375 [Anaerolineae bacterium]